jgi:membrane protease YdiL (CAAX protease family)
MSSESKPIASRVRRAFTLRRIFLGPDGIRAGWRLVIFYAIIMALFAGLFGILALMHPGGRRARSSVSQLTPSLLLITEGTIFVFTAVATSVMARIEHRRFSQYGLPLASLLGKAFWKGTAWGLLSISGTLLAIFALHGFHVTGLAIHGTTILASTAAWSITFLLVGMSEEFAFRGYPQFTLSSGIGFWPAAFLLSALFALAHQGNRGESAFGVTSVLFFGLLFCLFLRRTGNLWFPIGFHAGWDWGQTFLYGVPDSGLLPYHSLLKSSFSGPRWLTGGTVGPEGSIVTPIALLIAALIFDRLYRQARYRPEGN